jgi:DNA-binding transcriptional LysR family regulator
MELGNIDLNLLVVFEAIYSGGSISRAGKQLGMSQPAVSNALARLRELMDDALFVRTRRGVDPTVKARRLIGPVREALGLIEGQLKSGRQFDLASYKRLFRILMFDPLEPIMLPSVLRQIAEEAGGLRSDACAARRTSPRACAAAPSTLPAMPIRSTHPTSSSCRSSPRTPW